MQSAQNGVFHISNNISSVLTIHGYIILNRTNLKFKTCYALSSPSLHHHPEIWQEKEHAISENNLCCLCISTRFHITFAVACFGLAVLILIPYFTLTEVVDWQKITIFHFVVQSGVEAKIDVIYTHTDTHYNVYDMRLPKGEMAKGERGWSEW